MMIEELLSDVESLVQVQDLTVRFGRQEVLSLIHI